jgi:hypothetical protein
MRNRERQRGTATMYAYPKLAEVGVWSKVASASAMVILHPKLLRCRLVLIAARRISCVVGRGTIVRVLGIRCATCGIPFPFFNLWLSKEEGLQKIRHCS